MVLYTCKKCNKEFNQKSNYLTHINKKKSCDNYENNIIIYKCEKCNKEFNHKSNYITHINKKIPCNNKDLINENKVLLIKIKELENKNLLLENVNKYNFLLENEILFLKKENEKMNELYNNLLTKYTNTKTLTNIITNKITINLTNFGCENVYKLNKDEQINILKYSKQSLLNLIQYLHINDRIPEYKNICIKNLRSKGGYLFENNKWIFLNYDIMMTMLFSKKICNLNNILNNNEEFKDIQKIIDNYDNNNEEFIKNYKNNIINLLYNYTKNYKIG
jgi:uncharacterized C2H2 Zn-finger protein